MTPADVERLHKLFVDLTGRELPLDLAGYRASQWFAWAKEGFTEYDLRVVIEYVKRGIRDGKRNPGALKFINLICDPLKFGEDLEEAKAVQRNRVTETPRQEILRTTGRLRQTQYTVTPAGEAAFEALRKLKESL